MIMNEYETIYVTRPDLDAEEQTRLDEKFESVIGKAGSILVKEEWGKRKMAYEVQKHGYGRYTYLNFVGPADLPTEIERYVRIEDNVIRFLTVKLDDTVDPEACRVVAEERQRKRTEKRAAEAESRAAAASRRGGGDYHSRGRGDSDSRRSSSTDTQKAGAGKPAAAPAKSAAEPVQSEETPEAKPENVEDAD